MIKKEFENPNKVEIVEQAEEQTQRVYVGTLRPKGRNHTLFEFDTAKSEVRKAEFKVNKTVSFENAAKGQTSQKREVDGKPGCVYISALNLKNALKKFEKLHGESKNMVVAGK